MDAIYHQALKLLRRRDYTTAELRRKLVERFGEVPDGVIEQLIAKRFLDDRRFAGNLVRRRGDCHPARMRAELIEAGIDAAIADDVLSGREWPSLRHVLRAKMVALNLRPPLNRRDVARLFRTLSRLGYPEDEILEELEQFNEQ